MNYSEALAAAGGRDGLAAFDDVVAAPEFTPLPPGIYAARVTRGEYCSTKAGGDAYRIRWEVTDGPHAGQSIVRTWTFGAKAIVYTKRDLAPFGLTTQAALLSPFPPAGKEYHCRLVVALQRGNDGIERNDVKRIEIVRIDDSPAAKFLLPPSEEGAK